MRALSLRERRLIAIALAVLAVTLVWLLIIAPLFGGFAERAAERDTLSAAYQRNSRLINAIPAQRRRAEQQVALKDSFFLVAPNANLARDRLRERLRKEFVQAGGAVSAVQDVPAPSGSARAWVQGRITLPQLQALLGTLDNSQPYLITESLRITADKALETGRLDILDVRLEVSVPTLPAAR